MGSALPDSVSRSSRRSDFADFLPVAEIAAKHILSLPIYPTITDAQIDRVCDVLYEMAS